MGIGPLLSFKPTVPPFLGMSGATAPVLLRGPDGSQPRSSGAMAMGSLTSEKVMEAAERAAGFPAETLTAARAGTRNAEDFSLNLNVG